MTLEQEEGWGPSPPHSWKSQYNLQSALPILRSSDSASTYKQTHIRPMLCKGQLYSYFLLGVIIHHRVITLVSLYSWCNLASFCQFLIIVYVSKVFFAFFVSSLTFAEHNQMMLLSHLNPSVASQCTSKLFIMAFNTLHGVLPVTHLLPHLMLLFLLSTNIQLH